jgi:bifunctional enzyme CysN/CysC
VLPSGKQSTVARIVTTDGDLPEAVAGQSVTSPSPTRST